VENPYQPPLEAEVSAPDATALRPGLYPLAGLANLSLRLYLAATVYEVVAHLYDTFIAAKVEVPLHDEVATTPSDVIGIIITIVSWASIILFLIWMYRAAANARVLDPQAMTISPGMAVGGYFIPVVNLVLPYLAMAGIARASRVEWFWVAMWWAGHIGGVVLGGLYFFVSFHVDGPVPPTPLEVYLGHFLVFWSAITYFFSWQIMMRITRAQMTPDSPEEEAIPA
jgi:hypothetical protein